MDAMCGGSITMKTTKEANLMLEELAKNNYQPPSKRGDGRRQGGPHEVDRMSSLEANFEALMARLNQQAPKESTIGEITYMQAVAPLSRPDSFGGSEPSPGCSNVTQSPYQNHLSKTRHSVTLQLA